MEIIPLRSVHYQWESLLYRKDLCIQESYEQRFGTKVLVRNEDGTASKVKFSLYTNADEVYLIGPFNNWKKDKDYKLSRTNEGMRSIVTEKIKHKDPYLFLADDQSLRDPTSVYFDDEGNSIFWDFEDPKTYKKKYSNPDTLHRATKILQTDPVGLVAKWFTYDNNYKNLAESGMDLFTYIRNCGVLEKIKDLGFNTIQFLPVAQSIDGDNWKFRYLVAYPFAVHKNWGDPDSFAALIDECHKLDIAVIIDAVLSHCPFKDFKLFELNGEDVGIHKWKNNDNNPTYLDEYTPWGTMRFRYGDPQIRRYLVESALHFLHKYSVDGFRFDNVDGILRFGDNGDGDERPHGRLFMREIIRSIYTFNPLALIHLESHYFFGDNAKMLVAPLTSDPRALGATAYNSSRLTYYFHKEFMPKAVEDISVWRFEHIREEKEWGRSNSTVADFHNHDAAAGLMPERATGSYAYDALILKNPDLKYHAIGKIKVMEAIISFGCEGRTLDLLQTFLLQLGTFEHDSSIHWNLLNNQSSSEVVTYKKKVNELLEHPSFWHENTLYRKFINVDEKNKILVIKREDKTTKTNTSFYIIINLSSKPLNGYAIGLEKSGNYELIFNSDEKQYGGNDTSSIKNLFAKKSSNFEHFSKEIVIDTIAPYQILVLKR